MINPFFANHGILKHDMDNDGNSRVITINQTGHQINMNMTTPPFKCPLSYAVRVKLTCPKAGSMGCVIPAPAQSEVGRGCTS